MKKSEGYYTPFRYRKALFLFYAKSLRHYCTVFLFILVIILTLTLIYSNNSDKQPILVFIMLQLCHASIASIVFHIITNHLPKQKRKLDHNNLIHNSCAYINRDIRNFFESLADANDETKTNAFFKHENLKKVIESFDGLRPVVYKDTKIIFKNTFELITYVIDSIEKRANRMLLFDDIISERAIAELSLILNTCTNLRLALSFGPQHNLSIISTWACEIYLHSDLLGDYLFNDFKTNRILLHYINKHNELKPKTKEYHDAFWGEKK